MEINFQRTPVTLILTGIALALELVCTLRPEVRTICYQHWGLGILSSIWRGRIWQPFTTSLLHGGLLHAAFNIYWMFMFGTALELRFGWRKYFGLVLLLAYGSMMPQFLFSNFGAPIDGQARIVGLSGIVYGLFSLIWIARDTEQQLRLIVSDGVVMLMVGWLLLSAVLSHFGELPVANIAHVCGMLFGGLYGQAIFAGSHRRLWLFVASMVTAMVLTTVFYCPGYPLYEMHHGNG